MTLGDDPAHEHVILGSFPARHAAERMLASLGHEFRGAVRKRCASALVINANSDGSLKVRASRVVSMGNIANAVLHVVVFRAIGFFGILGTAKGSAQEDRALRAREGHVGAGEPAHTILAEAGPKWAVALVCCEQAIFERVATRAHDGALRHWDGSLQVFLDGLEPGKQDEVREALGVSSGAHR
jgi:hypothetical protein